MATMLKKQNSMAVSKTILLFRKEDLNLTQTKLKTTKTDLNLLL